MPYLVYEILEISKRYSFEANIAGSLLMLLVTFLFAEFVYHYFKKR